MQVGIDMGLTAEGRAATMDLEELLATRLLVQGNSGSGKSHLLRRLLEQSAPWVQQCVVDPEGDFVTLAEKYGHVVVDAAQHSEQSLQRVAARVRQHRVSVVLSLEGADIEGQMRLAAAFLGGLFDAERDYWYPMLVVVDEAQLFAPAAAGEVSDEARKASLGAMTNLMCRGRKRGLAGIIATQRLAKLAKNVAAEASNFLMGRTFLDIDMARAADLLGMERRQAEMFRDLQRGHFVALGPALSRRPLPIKVGPVETAGRGGSPKLMPLPDQPAMDARDLILTPSAAELAAPPPVRRAPPSPPPDINAALRIAGQRQAEMAATAALNPEPSLFDAAENDEKLDEVLRQVLSDPGAAFRTDAVLYQDFLVRCRIHRLRGETLDMPSFRRRLSVIRAGVDVEETNDPAWAEAEKAAKSLPEDMQGVFLLLARAALAHAPCPSDADVARACGSRSPGRARRLLSYLEQRGVIVQRTLIGGLRSIGLPHLGRETAAGDPHAPDPRDGAESDLLTGIN
ncbi:ATP-binding protein [Niveispirillum lacus]|uniref:ATP-binding protein n=1 Tax=Niveispirillum lacus TaxID=1981099 RepID=A0A255YUB6_9PROT|nr:ATP-binding protein [Niveispirillum lacus]OYQ32813.1 ATP-binding protein [Niveispirillum lacus]